MLALATVLGSVLSLASFVYGQDKYGQATCSTTIFQTSSECCGIIAGATTTSYQACSGCAPIYDTPIVCNCLVQPTTDPALTSTAIACSPTKTKPIITSKRPLPANVAAYCKDRAFPAIYPPTQAQLCCEGNLKSCKGLVGLGTASPSSYPTSSSKTVVSTPTECASTECLPNSQCSKCCAGDLKACDGLFPLAPAPTGVPSWCDGLSFTLQFPPSQEQQCCAGDLEKCEGLTGPPSQSAPCTTTVTHTASPCGDCGHQFDTTATVSLDCAGCQLFTTTVTAAEQGICVCPTETQTSVFACATTA